MKPTAPSPRERLRAQLADLKMPGALEALDDILRQVDGGTLAGPAVLEALLGAQISLHSNRRLVAAMRSSRLPAIKTLADFDFSFQPSVKREQIDSLHSLGFLERRENVVRLRPARGREEAALRALRRPPAPPRARAPTRRPAEARREGATT